MLAITDGAGRRAHIELPIELAEKLKAQIEAALVKARAHSRAERPPQEAIHGWKQTSFLEMSGADSDSQMQTTDPWRARNTKKEKPTRRDTAGPAVFASCRARTRFFLSATLSIGVEAQCG